LNDDSPPRKKILAHLKEAISEMLLRGWTFEGSYQSNSIWSMCENYFALLDENNTPKAELFGLFLFGFGYL
jgi:hypothetical protein